MEVEATRIGTNLYCSSSRLQGCCFTFGGASLAGMGPRGSYCKPARNSTTPSDAQQLPLLTLGSQPLQLKADELLPGLGVQVLAILGADPLRVRNSSKGGRGRCQLGGQLDINNAGVVRQAEVLCWQRCWELGAWGAQWSRAGPRPLVIAAWGCCKPCSCYRKHAVLCCNRTGRSRGPLRELRH